MRRLWLVFPSSAEEDFIFPFGHTVISLRWQLREASLTCRQIWIDLNIIIWEKSLSALKNRKHCHPHAKGYEKFLQDQAELSKIWNSLWVSPHVRIAWRVMKSPDVWASLPGCSDAVGLGAAQASVFEMLFRWSGALPEACWWAVAQSRRGWGWREGQAEGQTVKEICWCTKDSGHPEWGFPSGAQSLQLTLNVDSSTLPSNL